jgi:hypothetical protein
MPRWKIDPVWNQHVMGVSESYITGVVSDSVLATTVANLIDRRNAMLYRDYHHWVGIRVSRMPTDLNVTQPARESRVYLPGVNELDTGGKVTVPARGGAVDVTGFLSPPDQLRAVLQYRVKYDDTRSTIRYLSGIPDGVSLTEPGTFSFAGNLGWGNELSAFSAFIVANCYVVALLNTGDYDTVPARKLSLAGASPSALVVSVDTASAKPIAVGNKIMLTGFRRKAGKPGPSLNGTFYVDAISTTVFTGLTSYTLRIDPITDPSDWKVFGTVRKKGYGYFSIQKVDPYRVGIHQRGRPSLAPRGRRLTRLTLDP